MRIIIKIKYILKFKNKNKGGNIILHFTPKFKEKHSLIF